MAERLRGGRDCAWLGMKIFFVTAIAMVVMWFGMLLAYDANSAWGIFRRNKLIFHLLRTLYVGLTLTVFFGAASGWAQFRWGPRGGKIWLEASSACRKSGFDAFVFLVPCFWFIWPIALLLFLLSRLSSTNYGRLVRDSDLLWAKFPGPLPTVMYIWCAYLVWDSETTSYRFPNTDAVAWSLGLALFGALSTADLWLATRIQRENAENRLELPRGGWRFSLSTLIFIMLFVGGWISGMLLFFRDWKIPKN